MIKNVILGIFAVIVVWFALTSFGLFADRQIQKVREETRSQVYDTSREYNEGVNRDLSHYCYEFHKEDSNKKGLAALIRTTADTFKGIVLPDNQTCITEAKEY